MTDMYYADLLWDNPEMPLLQSQGHRQLFSDFLQAVSERIEIEENYASDLKSLASRVDKQLNRNKQDSSSLIFIFSALKSNLLRREAQTVSFSQLLKDEILDNIKQLHDTQVAEGGKVQRQIRSLQLGLGDMKVKMSAAKSKIAEIDKARQDEFVKLQVLKARFFLNKDEHQKQASRARNVERQYTDFEEIYKAVMKDYNSYIDNYSVSMREHLNVLQKHEMVRTSSMMDNVKKILVFETSMMRNFEYDITNIIQQLSSLEVEKDTEHFARKYSKCSHKIAHQNVPKLSLINTVIYQMITNKLDDNIRFERNEANRSLALNIGKEEMDQSVKSAMGDRYQTLADISRIALEAQSNGLQPESKERLGQLLKKSENRNYLQLCIRAQVQQNNHDSNLGVVSVCELLIEKSLAKKDVFSLRGILKTIFSQLNVKSLKNKQELLYVNLYELPIWRNPDFWDAAVFEAIQEQLRIGRSQKEESKQEAKTRQKSIIFSQLINYCYMMVMLGHTIKGIKQTAGKYCRVYSIGDQENRELSKKIQETVKIFRESWEQEP